MKFIIVLLLLTSCSVNRVLVKKNTCDEIAVDYLECTVMED